MPTKVHIVKAMVFSVVMYGCVSWTIKKAAAAAAKSLQSCPTLCDPIDTSVVSNSVPTRLPCPWDSPGKNTGVGCHFLLQCMKVKSESEVAQTRQTFVGQVMSLLFNMLSRFLIDFIPRSKRLLISWLQSPSTVIQEPKKIKSVTVFIFSPSISHEVMGPDAMILVF